jgi:cytoskeletal protein CcmA (bactofilin family)
MEKSEKVSAFLGKDTEFEGKLSFYGTIRIDGRFEGDISAIGTLIVGETGMIEANVHVSYIVVNGMIRGDIIADERIDLHAPGKVFGNINSPVVVIDEGAIFDGNCRMEKAKEADEEELTAEGSVEYAGGPSTSLGTIQGIVTREQTISRGTTHDIATAIEEEKRSEPLRSAEISAKCKGVGKKRTKTDGSGFYELTDLEDGKWELRVKSKGHKDIAATVEVSGGGVYEKNLE